MTAIHLGKEIHDVSTHWTYISVFGIPLLILYVVVIVLVLTGFVQILLNFNSNARMALDVQIKDQTLPGVTVLRPLKGIDPEMELCLESTFLQKYPQNKLEIIFCVQDANDPAIPLVQKLIKLYPKVNSKLLVGEDYFGPNPKVNNLHKGYKEAQNDIIWILDSNVYTHSSILRRSVFTLNNNLNNNSSVPTILGGLDKRVRLVTHVPIVYSKSTHSVNWGSKLDEMFMSTSHAKFYIALNRIQPAPCINGKSNLFRRSDLDESVANMNSKMVARGDGLSHFAKYIGEDNMIGIALWDGKNGCAGMTGDYVVQPISGQNSVRDYIDRRVRWLRVRKYMVLAATLLEPTTESLVSGIIGSFSVNMVLHNRFEFDISWFSFHMTLWFIIDYIQYKKISINCEREVTFQSFAQFWLLREILALPIWIMAMAGSKIEWRGQPFRILSDLTAEAIL